MPSSSKTFLIHLSPLKSLVLLQFTTGKSGVVLNSSSHFPFLVKNMLLDILTINPLLGKANSTGSLPPPSPPVVVPIIVAKLVSLQNIEKDSDEEYTLLSTRRYIFPLNLELLLFIIF